MMKAADKAARRLRRDFGEVENLQVSKKGPADFVSNADIKAESIIREELSYARPDYGFLMEESGSHPGQDPQQRRWIVDPLDGTINFLHGLPHWAISIALEERGELIAGLIYDPLKDETFTAEKGQGAYLNDRRIRISSQRDLAASLIATGVVRAGATNDYLAEVQAVLNETSGIRRWGTASLDLAYVAAGRYQGFWERGLSPWDIAAGIVIVREAGGLISETNGKPIGLNSSSILAANDSCHLALMKIFKKATASQG
ncbi:MAG: inositol monophosphatase family protein [Pseudomonadota bacterium]